MATTKPAPKGGTINYPGKVYQTFRKMGNPPEIALAAKYFKDYAYQIWEEHQDPLLYDLVIDRLAEIVSENSAQSISKENAKSEILRLMEEHPDVMQQIIQNMIEDSYRNKMRFITVTTENIVYNDLSIVDKGQYLGGEKKEKKLYYSRLGAEIGRLISIDKNGSPVIRFIGNPGTGKTNGAVRLAEEAALMGYWIYSNVPLRVREPSPGQPPLHLNVFTISAVSDLFKDSPDIPSVLRVRVASQKYGRVLGAYFLRDEKARGMERYAMSKAVTSEASALQVRRHVFLGYLGAGTMDDTGEVKNAQTVQIETKMMITSQFSGGRPVKKFSWIVRKRRGGSDQYHDEDTIHGIPPPWALRYNFPNVYEMPNPVYANMQVDYLFDELESGRLNDEEMIRFGAEMAEEAEEWLRQQFDAKRTEIKRELDRKKIQRVAYCYNCDRFFATRQKEERPNCPSCNNRNTTADPRIVIALFELKEKGEEPTKENAIKWLVGRGAKKRRGE